jgi:hypothetical protein
MNYRASTEIVTRKNQDGTVVIMKMDDSNNFFKINGIASEVWNAIQNEIPLNQLKQKITSEYDVTDDQLNKDIDSLIKTLIEKNLIESI